MTWIVVGVLVVAWVLRPRKDSKTWQAIAEGARKNNPTLRR